LSDTVAPTLEWQRKHQHEAPVTDQARARKTFRRVTQFETLRNRGDIEPEHYSAAQRFEGLYYGAQGADVRTENETSGDTEREFARTACAQELARCEKALLPAEFRALEALVHDIQSVEDIGRKISGAQKREIARARGLGIVVSGLERLALMWGMKGR
jgi:hypothetical protein